MQNFGNSDRSRNNERQRQNFRQIQNGHRNGNRRGNYRQNLVEVTLEIEAGKTLGEIIIITIEADQEKEAPHPEDILIDDIIAQVQIQNLGVDQILG